MAGNFFLKHPLLEKRFKVSCNPMTLCSEVTSVYGTDLGRESPVLNLSLMLHLYVMLMYDVISCSVSTQLRSSRWLLLPSERPSPNVRHRRRTRLVIKLTTILMTLHHNKLHLSDECNFDYWLSYNYMTPVTSVVDYEFIKALSSQ